MISATPCEGYTTFEPTANKSSGVAFFTKCLRLSSYRLCCGQSGSETASPRGPCRPCAVQPFYRAARAAPQSGRQRFSDASSGGGTRRLERFGAPRGAAEDERAFEQRDRGE